MNLRSATRRLGLLAAALTVGITSLVAGSGTAYAAPPYPLCDIHNSPGPDGVVTVQTIRRNITWGVRMNPSSKSIGQWVLGTYLDGKKTSSGFNRAVVDGPYQPHGTVPGTRVRPGQVFTVRGAIIAGPETEYLVISTPCITL